MNKTNCEAGVVKNLWTRWARRGCGLPRRGNVLVYVVVIFLALLGIASYAVDYAIIRLTKVQFYSAMDSAGLAAAAGLTTSPAQARTNAKTFAAANKVNGTGLVLQDTDIVLGSWNPSTRVFTAYTTANEPNATAVQVNGVLSAARGNSVPLMFAQLFGMSSVRMTKTIVAGYGAGTDVMVIQDLSQSFSSVISSSKSGDSALLSAINTNGGNSYFGVVAMTGWGQTISAMKKVSSNYTALSNSINSLQQCGSSGMPVCSGSDMAAGINQAISEMTTNASYPNRSNTQVPKAMILVSDGAPSSSSSGSHPNSSDAQLLTLAQTSATTAYSTYGINVYVVFYNPGNDTTGLANLQTLVRGKGVLVQATTPSGLVTALTSITKYLPMQILK